MLIHPWNCFSSFEGNCSSITLKRVSEFCLEVNYEGSEVPYSAIPAFIAFNGANRRVKEILEKGPPLIKFLQLVVDNAKDLRREILVAGARSAGTQVLGELLR